MLFHSLSTVWPNCRMDDKLNCLSSEILFTGVANTTSRLDGAGSEKPQSGGKIPHQNETAN